MGPEQSQLPRHLGKHFSASCPALQSECWKKENGFSLGAENLHGEIYHSQSRCFLANITSPLFHEAKTRHPSQIPYLKEAELTGRCYLHQCTERGAYKVQAEGSPWASCLPGKAIQVGIVSEKLCSTLAKGSLEVLVQWYYPTYFDVHSFFFFFLPGTH